MSARRYDLYGRLLPDTDPDSDWYWVHKPDFDAKERECERLIAAQSREGRHALRVENERLRELLREARDFLSEHELNVFGAGATLFTKLCAALKEGKP